MKYQNDDTKNTNSKGVMHIMYYIINQSNKIIAISNALLSLLEIKNIKKFVSKTTSNELQLTLLTEKNTTIIYKDNTYEFHAHIHTLSSTLGNLRLVHLQEIDTKKIRKKKTSIEKPNTLKHSSIFIDIKSNSKIIGISQDDYKDFLNEYIDNAISLEDALRSNDKEERIVAIETLTQLANTLQLTKINEIVINIERLSSDDRSQAISSFYTLLSRLTIYTKPKETEPYTNSFGRIELQHVTPIEFNFQISQVADDLSLPEELIEKFIHDFIEQMHEKTEQILKAYEEGDLDTIHKISRLLKSTSNNLHIRKISDTLHAIQVCDDITQLEELIKEYWGYFLSLEKQFNIIPNKGNS